MNVKGILAAALVAFMAGSAAGETKLAENGKALAKIVIAKDCVRAAKFAADDLKWHLDGITGANFEIVTDDQLATITPKPETLVFVGESSLTKAKNAAFAKQEFTVDVAPGRIELAGRDKEDRNLKDYRYVYDAEKGLDLRGVPGMYDEQGTLYAVYDFLEKELGAVWADAPDCGTVLPRRPTLAVKTGTRRLKPFMAYRGGTFGQGDGYVPTLTHRKRLERKAYEDMAYLNDTDRKSRKTLFLLRNRAGGDRRPCNHSFYWCYDRFYYKGGERFIAYHPDWFAQGYHGKPPQMCYSNPEFIRQTIEDVRAYFDVGGYTNRYTNQGVPCSAKNPVASWGRDFYALEPMDSGSFCKCPRCTAEYEMNRPGSEIHSTHWFKFVNKVAKEIGKSHPDKRISTLAYATHMGLPTDIRLEPNVVVYFCLSCNRGPMHGGLKTQLKQLRDWHAAYPDCEFGLWLYNTFPLEFCQNGGYNCFPGFFMHVAEEEYRIFKECKVTSGIFHCGFNGETDNYMQLKWMFDPDRRAEDMLREYFLPAGKGARPLMDFYRLVERRYTDLSLLPKKGDSKSGPEMAWGVRGNAETMAELGRLMSEAEEAVKGGTAAERKFVALWKQAVWKWMQAGRAEYVARSSAPQDSWTAVRVPDAGGDGSKVDWSGVKTGSQRYFHAGGGEEVERFSCEVKVAYDSTHFYLALTDIGGDTSKLVRSPGIAAFDTWEFMMAFQRGLPSRYYLTNAFGDGYAQSDGEVNFRRNVSAKESGDPTYGMRFVTDRSKPDRWTNTYAFPLSTMLLRPVVPGDTIYLNAVRVMSSAYAGGGGRGPAGMHICTLTSYSAVHTIDRAVSITLAK
ncbi:MAG: DUF4838 domain-containing protein [Kiritimatiellae bacterium]|nr:DUF4838 domain-containing protein [Kiritimatiellia bacterium]